MDNLDDVLSALFPWKVNPPLGLPTAEYLFLEKMKNKRLALDLQTHHAELKASRGALTMHDHAPMPEFIHDSWLSAQERLQTLCRTPLEDALDLAEATQEAIEALRERIDAPNG